MPWLDIKNKNDVGEIYVYGEIADYKWMDETSTPASIKSDLAKLKTVNSINMYVNSPGGNVFAGVAIYNELKRLNKPLTAYVDGIAASIASLIILAADEVVMPSNTMLMIHNPWMMVAGNANDLREYADKLDKINDSVLVDTYVDKTGIERDEIKRLLDAETWLSAEEAKLLGFADRVEKELKVAASLKGNKATFKGVEIAIDNFKSFPKLKIPVHQEEKSVFSAQKQRHEHTINMLTAQL